LTLRVVSHSLSSHSLDAGLTSDLGRNLYSVMRRSFFSCNSVFSLKCLSFDFELRHFMSNLWSDFGLFWEVVLLTLKSANFSIDVELTHVMYSVRCNVGLSSDLNFAL